MVSNLNWMESTFRSFSEEVAMQHRQDPVRLAHGLPAMDYFHADRRPVWVTITGSGRFQAEQYRVSTMAFAQLTYRESLRDIETCLSVQHRNLPGFRQPVRRSTRPMPTKGATGVSMRLAQRLTPRRGRCTSTKNCRDLTNTVYALARRHRSVPVGFPWAHFRTTKAAVKMHTLLDLRGNIPSFIHSLGWQGTTALDMLLPEAGALVGIVATSTPAFMCCTKPGHCHACQANDAHRSRRRRIARPVSFAPTISLDGFYPVRISPNFCGASASRTPSPAAGLHHQQLLASGRHHLRAHKSRWLNSSSSGSSASSVKQFYGTSENAVKTQIWIAVSVYVLGHRQEAPRPGRLALHFVTDPLGDPLRKCPYIKHLRETKTDATLATTKNLFDF